MKLSELIFELHLPQNFFRRYSDIHLLKMVKSCSRLPKACKSTKKRKSKIFTKTILIEKKNENIINVIVKENYMRHYLVTILIKKVLFLS